MPSPSPVPAGPSPRAVAFYNAVPSVLWSGLCLGPLVAYCYQHVAQPWVYGALGLSLLGYALPKTWFRYWQLSTAPGAYRRVGVPVVNLFTQHGALVNRLLRRRYPRYQHLRSRKNGAALVAGSYHMERFHVVGLAYFLLMSVHAAGRGHYGWLATLTLLNVLYNLYPIWLQQYLRVRLGAMSKRAC